MTSLADKLLLLRPDHPIDKEEAAEILRKAMCHTVDDISMSVASQPSSCSRKRKREDEQDEEDGFAKRLKSSNQELSNLSQLKKTPFCFLRFLLNSLEADWQLKNPENHELDYLWSKPVGQLLGFHDFLKKEIKKQ